MKPLSIFFLALLSFTVGCSALGVVLGREAFAPLPATQLATTQPPALMTPTPSGDPGAEVPDSIDISITPSQWLDGSDYLLSGPALAEVTASGPVVQVEFYSLSAGEEREPVLQFIDRDGSDGWSWHWQVPQGGQQVWAEAIYPNGARALSNRLLVSIPEPSVTPPPAGWLTYHNPTLGYSLGYPPGWLVDEYGMSQANREVTINPPNAEPFIVYLSVLLDGRTLDEVRQSYAEHFPDLVPVEVKFAGQNALQYRHSTSRLEMYVPLPYGVFLFTSDRADQPEVQQMLASFLHTVPIGIPPSGPQRIAFDPGATSATVEGTVVGVSVHTYVLWAREGQTMTVQVTSPQNNVLLTIAGQDGLPLVRSHVGHPTQWSGVLTASQDYFVTLSVEEPVTDQEPYVMQVSITG